MHSPTASTLHMDTAAAEETTASPLNRSHAPLLLFDYGPETAGQQASDADEFFFYSIPKKQVLATRVVDEMRDHRYWTTPQGWLLMAARGSPDTFLWDPFTGTRISLPLDHEGFLMGDDDGHLICLLSRKPVVAAHPEDDDCAVDVLVLSLVEGTVFWHCRVGRDVLWLRHEYHELPLATLSTLNGRFIMKFVDKVVMLELSTQPVAFTEIPVDDIDPASLPPCTYFMSQLVESRGDLFCIHFLLSDLLGRIIDGISVFKLDLPARAWVKAESLDGMAVFLVHSSQFGAASLDPQDTAGLKGDCIYYYMPGDKAIYVYDVGRGTTILHNPGLCLVDHHSPKVLMMPTC